MRYSPQSAPLRGARSKRLASAVGTKCGPVCLNGLIEPSVLSTRGHVMPYPLGSIFGLLQSANVAIQPCQICSGVLVALALVAMVDITRWSEKLASAVGSVTSSDLDGSIVGTGQVTASSLCPRFGVTTVAQPASAAQSTECWKMGCMGGRRLQPRCRQEPSVSHCRLQSFHDDGSHSGTSGSRKPRQVASRVEPPGSVRCSPRDRSRQRW